MAILIGVCGILIIALGMLGPVYIESQKENWGSELNEHIENIEESVLNNFSIKQAKTLFELEEVKSKVKNKLVDIPSQFSLKDSLLSLQFPGDYSVIIEDSSGELVYWNYESISGSNFLLDDYYRPGETYFISNTIFEFLTVYDTLESNYGKLIIAVYLPIEKNYSIQNKYYKELSLTQKLSAQFGVEFEINYNRNSSLSRDGRKHSVPILNNDNNKIAVATFVKPMRDVELKNIENIFDVIQSILTAFVLILVGILLIKFLGYTDYLLVRFVILFAYIIFFRYALHWLNFSALFNNWELSNSKYFSSLFGYGIVDSPFELFVTLIFASTAIFYLFKYSVLYLNKINYSKSWLKFIGISVVFIALYFLSERGLGASIKSVIFDSSLRYYKEDSLFPNFIEAFMLLNILLLGMIVFVGSLSFLIIIFKNFPDKIRNGYGYLTMFVIFQVVGILFDVIQKEPQGSPIFRILFILLHFIFLLFILRNKSFKFTYFFGYAFASSLLVILLLGQYNSLIEKESLRKSAYNLTRQNAELLRFAVYETLVEAITDRETVQSFKSEHVNPNAVAFKFWSNSILQKEALGSSVTLLDANHNSIGSFNFRFRKSLQVDWHEYSEELSDLHEIKIFEESIIYSDNKIIRGIATVEDVEGVLGYVTVSVLYDLTSLNLPNAPEFLSSDAGYINDTIDFSKLKIFDFHNGTLINSLSNYSLGENEIIAILDADFNEYGEAWLEVSINNENHLMFILKREQDNISRVLAVALKEKELSWGLFDFFKIFFVHLLIIVVVFLIYLGVKLTKTEKVKYTFATKLLLSFILISLIPLILVSFFFRTVTTAKNDSAIEYKLDKRAASVEDYLKTYLTESNANLNAISEKATKDLGIDFTLYKDYKFIYSSNNQYYLVGLIPKILSPDAYDYLFVNGSNETVLKEQIESYSFNALYYKTSLLGEFHVIKITDAFNKIMLPLSGQEVDVYIFVSYFVALIIILVLGFILTNQISKPISDLKNATRSVASGDLNVEVKSKTRDEVSELVTGFNYMVKELKRSQAELAEFERETAWKEMAKQVAHEIKNPLTPMKLSVQQLIAAFNDKSPKFDELFKKVTNTVINQIETLKNIASEFSSFARMPNPKIEKVNLNELIKEAVDLFTDEKAVVSFQAGNQVDLNVDRDQLRRVFINLIRNSIQANATNVDLSLEKVDSIIWILIKDNGVGIPEEIRDKIFENEFSTKTQGMGLGLAMAKKTIENYNGEISISDSSFRGTTILIKLPII